MSKHVASSSKRQGRPRSVAAQDALLKATLELLLEQPLPAVTVDAIAQRSGASKATIYKWWPSKSHIALDAFLSQMETEVPTPDTGSALTDFVHQLQAVVTLYTSPRGKLFCQFVAAGQSDQEFLALFRERFLAPRRDAVRVIWKRAVERGEVPPDVDSEIALDLIYGPSFYRLMTQHAPLGMQEVETLVRTAFCGLQKSQESSSEHEGKK